MEASVAVPKDITYLDVLQKMEALLPGFQLTDKVKINELARLLLAITQEDLRICKQTAEKRRLRWEGKLSLFGSSREQDGFWWGHTDYVVIEEGTITLITEGSRGTKENKEKYIIGATLQNNENFLKRAFHCTTKETGNPAVTVVIHEITVTFSDAGEVANIVVKNELNLA